MMWNKEIISENLQLCMKVVTFLIWIVLQRIFFPLIPCLAQNPNKLFQDWRHGHVQGNSMKYALSLCTCNLKVQKWHHLCAHFLMWKPVGWNKSEKGEKKKKKKMCSPETNKLVYCKIWNLMSNLAEVHEYGLVEIVGVHFTVIYHTKCRFFKTYSHAIWFP